MDRDTDDLKRDGQSDAERLNELLRGTNQHEEHDVIYRETVRTTVEETNDKLTHQMRAKADAFVKCYLKCNSDATQEDQDTRRKWFQNMEVRVANTIFASKIYQYQDLTISRRQDVSIWLGKTADTLVLILPAKSSRQEFVLMKYLTDELQPYIGPSSMVLKDLIKNILTAQEPETITNFLEDAPDIIIPDTDHDKTSTQSHLPVHDTQSAATEVKVDGVLIAEVANTDGRVPTVPALSTNQQHNQQSGQNLPTNTTATDPVQNPSSSLGSVPAISTLPPFPTPSTASGGLFSQTAPNIGFPNVSGASFGTVQSNASGSAFAGPTSAAIPQSSSSGGQSLFAVQPNNSNFGVPFASVPPNSFSGGRSLFGFQPNSSVAGIQGPSVLSNGLLGTSPFVNASNNAPGGLFGIPTGSIAGGPVCSSPPNITGGSFGSAGPFISPRPGAVDGSLFQANTGSTNPTHGGTVSTETAQSTSTSKSVSSHTWGAVPTSLSEVFGAEPTSSGVTNLLTSSTPVTSPWPTQHMAFPLPKGSCCDPKLMLPMGPVPQSDGFFAEKDGTIPTITNVFKTITHHPDYQRWSLEELRLAHYQ